MNLKRNYSKEEEGSSDNEEEEMNVEQIALNQQKLFNVFEQNLQKTLNQINSFSLKPAGKVTGDEAQSKGYKHGGSDSEEDAERANEEEGEGSDMQADYQMLQKRFESLRERKFEMTESDDENPEVKETTKERVATEVKRGPLMGVAGVTGYASTGHKEEPSMAKNRPQSGKQLESRYSNLKPAEESNEEEGEEELIEEEESPEKEEEDAEDNEDEQKMQDWRKELEEKFKKFDNFRDKRLGEEAGRGETRNQPMEKLKQMNEPQFSGVSFKLNQIMEDQPTQGVKIKDMIQAKKEKDMKAKETSPEPASLYERNNFFGKQQEKAPEGSISGKYQKPNDTSHSRQERPFESYNPRTEKAAEPYNYRSDKGIEQYTSKQDSQSFRPAQDNANNRLDRGSETSSHRECEGGKSVWEDIQKKDKGIEDEVKLIRGRLMEAELELTKQKKESDFQMQKLNENNAKSLERSKLEYEREIRGLKEELEEAYTEMNHLKLEKQNLTSKKHSHVAVIRKETASQTVSEDALEKNFLKLKELYDSLYKANASLLRDHNELEEKYTKLLKVFNKSGSKVEKKSEAKRAIKIKEPSVKKTNSTLHNSDLSRNGTRNENSRSLSKGRQPSSKEKEKPTRQKNIQRADATRDASTSKDSKEEHNALKSYLSYAHEAKAVNTSNSMIKSSVNLSSNGKNTKKEVKEVELRRSRSRNRDHDHSNSSMKNKDSASKAASKRSEKRIPKPRTCLLVNNPTSFK